MALIFLRVLIVYIVSSFSSASQVALTSLQMMTGPDSSDLSPLDYQVWGQCWSLIKSWNISQKQFLSLKMHFSLFCRPYH